MFNYFQKQPGQGGFQGKAHGDSSALQNRQTSINQAGDSQNPTVSLGQMQFLVLKKQLADPGQSGEARADLYLKLAKSVVMVPYAPGQAGNPDSILVYEYRLEKVLYAFTDPALAQDWANRHQHGAFCKVPFEGVCTYVQKKALDGVVLNPAESDPVMIPASDCERLLSPAEPVQEGSLHQNMPILDYSPEPDSPLLETPLEEETSGMEGTVVSQIDTWTSRTPLESLLVKCNRHVPEAGHPLFKPLLGALWLAPVLIPELEGIGTEMVNDSEGLDSFIPVFTNVTLYQTWAQAQPHTYLMKELEFREVFQLALGQTDRGVWINPRFPGELKLSTGHLMHMGPWALEMLMEMAMNTPSAETLTVETATSQPDNVPELTLGPSWVCPTMVSNSFLPNFEANRSALRAVFINHVDDGNGFKPAFFLLMQEGFEAEFDTVKQGLLNMTQAMSPFDMPVYRLNDFPYELYGRRFLEYGDAIFTADPQLLASARYQGRTINHLLKDTVDAEGWINIQSESTVDLFRRLANSRVFLAVPQTTFLPQTTLDHAKREVEGRQYWLAFTSPDAVFEFSNANPGYGYVSYAFQKFCGEAEEGLADGVVLNPDGPDRCVLSRQDYEAIARGTYPTAAQGAVNESWGPREESSTQSELDNRAVEHLLRNADRDSNRQLKEDTLLALYEQLMERSVFLAVDTQAVETDYRKAKSLMNKEGATAVAVFTSPDMGAYWISLQSDPVELLPVLFRDFCRMMVLDPVDIALLNPGNIDTFVKMDYADLSHLANGDMPPRLNPAAGLSEDNTFIQVVPLQMPVHPMLEQTLKSVFSQQGRMVEAAYLFQVGFNQGGKQEVGVGILVRPEFLDLYEEGMLSQVEAFIAEVDAGKGEINLFVLNHLPGFAEQVRQAGQLLSASTDS